MGNAGMVPKRIANFWQHSLVGKLIKTVTSILLEIKFVLFRLTHRDVLQVAPMSDCYTEASFMPDNIEQQFSGVSKQSLIIMATCILNPK